MTDIDVAQAAGTGPDGAARTNEDVVMLLGTAVLLLDGATSLRPELPSGGWYATTLAGRLAAELAERPRDDLRGVLADAIAAVAATHDLRPGASPSSTVAMLRWSDDEVDALVLADSPVVVFTSSGSHLVEDGRLAALPRHRGGYRDRLRSGGGYDADHVAALRASGRRFDALRNTEGGFWVAEADPRAAWQATTARWPRAEVRSALLASDGISCGVDDYGLWSDWAALRAHGREHGPAAVVRAVRDAEADDPDGTRWPRPKPQDDKTLVLVEFGDSVTPRPL